MTRRRIRRLVGFFVLSLAVAVGANVVLQGLDNHTGRSTTPVGYVGIVSSNFESSGADDEIIGDFGTAGVWAYHNGVWTQLTTSNPDWIFGAQFGSADDELIADFGSAGLWMWNYSGWPGVWTRLTMSNAEQAIAIDDDNDNREELQVDFGSLGLWRFDWDTMAWIQMTALNPVGRGFRIDMMTVGWDEGLWEFSGMGLWASWYQSGVQWIRLTLTTSTDDAASGNFMQADANEELIIDFSGIGTWLYDEGAWTKLTDTNAMALGMVRFGGATDDEVVFADEDARPWWWGGSSWSRLTWSVMDEGFVVDWNANGLADTSVETELAVDFGTLGLWRYDYTEGWTQLTASNPVFIVRSDYYQDGTPTSLVAWFGAGVGLWLYDSGGGVYGSSWHKLTDTVPNSNVSW